MGGFNIGIGVGLKYPTSSKIKISAQPPEQDITDALLMEDGSIFIMDDGSYFKIELVVSKTSSCNNTSTIKTDKSYWNF